MKHATLRQLRILAAIATEGSFSAAAKRLHLTQPAISQQIRRLEDRCGMALLERNRRSVLLTQAGREVVRAAQAVDRELKLADDTINALKKN